MIMKRPPPPFEVRTHIAIADTVRLLCRPGWIWTHLPFGGKRSAITGALLKRMGTNPGWPDFCFISPDGEVHFLELKRGNNVLTEHQELFFAAMEIRSIECRVARSYDEALAILAQWGVLPIGARREREAA